MSEFYNLHSLSNKVLSWLSKDARELSSDIRVDELDCSKSFMRQPTTKSVKEVVSLCVNKEGTLWALSLRNDGYGEVNHGELFARTASGSIEYFLWVDMSVENLNKLVKKYKLKKL